MNEKDKFVAKALKWCKKIFISHQLSDAAARIDEVKQFDTLTNYINFLSVLQRCQSSY